MVHKMSNEKSFSEIFLGKLFIDMHIWLINANFLPELF